MPDWRVAVARAATVSGNSGLSASLKLVDIWIKSVRSGTRRWPGSGPWLKRRRSNDKHWPMSPIALRVGHQHPPGTKARREERHRPHAAFAPAWRNAPRLLHPTAFGEHCRRRRRATSCDPERNCKEPKEPMLVLAYAALAGRPCGRWADQ